MGTISSTGQVYILNLKIGTLNLAHLAVDGIAHPGHVNLSAGQNATWPQQ